MSKEIKKPINRAKLIAILRQASVDLINAEHSNEYYELSKYLKWSLESLKEAIEEVDTNE